MPSASIPLDKAVIASVSGAALIQKNLPLYLYAECRQEQYHHYECEHAKVVLTCADAVYGGFADVLSDFQLTVQYPEPYPDVPPDDKEAYLDELKDRGELSEVQVVMRRFKMTRQEAIDHIEQVLKDQAEVAALKAKYGVDQTPPPQPQTVEDITQSKESPVE